MKFLVIFLLALSIKIDAEVSSVSSKHTDDHKNHIKTDGKDHVAGELDPLKYYQSFLRKKRMEQSTALKNIVAFENVQRQHSVVNELITSILRVLAASKKAINDIKFDPKSGQFPTDNEALREHVASVIENVPFLCEFILYYPQVLKKEYNKNADFKDVVNWGYQFSLDFGIYDEHTREILNLAGQELEIIERDENYVNPYEKMDHKEQMQREAVEKANQARELKKQAQKLEAQKKKKMEKGPKLSRGGEL